MRRIGLRVDVDTLGGLRKGVPALLDLFGELQVRASFFVTLGPDRSGLAIRSLFLKRGSFGRLMRLRGVYGLRAGFYGLLLPSPRIGESNPRTLKQVKQRGHEVGLHGWDHRQWQDLLPWADCNWIDLDYRTSIKTYRTVFRRQPQFSASPGWIADSRSLTIQERFGFRFASDLRGTTPFYPVVDGVALKTLQLPVTLPTLDELIASRDERRFLALSLRDLDIYCAHAEVEGISKLGLFRDFLLRTEELGFSTYRLSDICEEVLETGQRIPRCETGQGVVPGRAGKVAVQMQEIQ